MKTGYDIIIQAGQSNAQGCGIEPRKNAYVPRDDVLYYADDFEKTVKENNILTYGQLYICDLFLFLWISGIQRIPLILLL